MQDNNEYFDLEHALDAFGRDGAIPENIGPADDDTLEEMIDTVRAMEEQGDVENRPHLVRARRLMPMQVAANIRHRRRQGEINRQKSLQEGREETDEERLATLKHMRWRGITFTPSEQREFDELQGSGAIAGMGFATYLG